jgi:hypothetical protein
MLGSCFKGLTGLVGAPPREPLLALPARFGPALDVSSADL